MKTEKLIQETYNAEKKFIALDLLDHSDFNKFGFLKVEI